MGCIFSCTDCLASQCPCYSGIPEYQNKTQIADQPELLNKSLNKVSVMTSHNTYIHTLQVGSVSSTRGIEIALAKGARCIELDLFREENKPETVFIAHGQEKEGKNLLGTTKLPLQDALEYISLHAFNKTSDPLFIALEVNCARNETSCNTIAYLFEQYLATRLYKGKLDPGVLLKDLVGKVILIHGGGVVGERLNNLVNEEWGAALQNAPCAIDPSQLAFGSSAVRVYPVGFESDVLSSNYDPLPMLTKGATFVAMNVCTQDQYLQVYENYFKKSSFIAV